MDPVDQHKKRAETRHEPPPIVPSGAVSLTIGTVEATQWQAIVEAMTDGVVVFGRDGRAIHMNAAARGLLALESAPEGPTGPLGPDVTRGHVVDAQGQPVPRAAWPLSRLLAGEVLTSERAVDVRFRRSDGRTVVISVSGAPLRDGNGCITGAVTTLRDVTMQRQLEARTREALDALLAMAEVLVQATAESTTVPPARADEQRQPAQDPTARRLAQLTQRLLGCERLWMVAVEIAARRQHPVAVAGLSGEQMQAWWAETEQTPFVDHPRFAFIARLEAGEPIVIDLRQPSFSEPPFSDAPNPWGVRSALMAPMRVRGRLIGVLAYDYGPVDHDFTSGEVAFAAGVAKLAALVLERERLLDERAAAQADALALREASRRMDEFVGVVAHELRTPLTSVVAYLQIMERQLDQLRARGVDALPGEELRSFVARLAPALARSDRQARRLTRLVADLLDLSRIQAGRLTLRREEGNLAPLVREVIEEQRLAHPDRTITLTAPASVEPVRVEMDPDRVSQVLTNYLSNALKYAPADRPIDVAIRRARQGAREGVRVEVHDQGPGLPPAEQTRVWDRFYRGTWEHEEAMGNGPTVGLGLGLYISKTIIELHGGQVGVRSAVGKGTTFFFTLPVAARTSSSIGGSGESG